MRQRIVRTTSAAGFTLVELLVVIGIIALLVGVLLPALAGARRVSQRVACAAKLNQLMLAAELHQQEHQGYYPLVGIVPTRNPDKPDGAGSLYDSQLRRYSYLSIKATVQTLGNGSFVPRELAPITDALAVYMGFKNQILSPTNGTAVSNMYDASGYMRNFLCPAQATSFADVAVFDPPATSAILCPLDGTNPYYEPQSYIYNEAVLGYDDVYNRLRGHAGQVRFPSQTMFACDGLPGTMSAEVGGCATFTLYNLYKPTKPSQPTTVTVTVGDALNGTANLAADPRCFDRKRHANMVNVAFCDGHVESRYLTAKNLSTVYLFTP